MGERGTPLARDELAGQAPSLAVLLGSPSHAAQAADVLTAVQQIVESPALIGSIAQTIVAGGHEMEDESAVAVWLASGLAADPSVALRPNSKPCCSADMVLRTSSAESGGLSKATAPAAASSGSRNSGAAIKSWPASEAGPVTSGCSVGSAA